MSIKEIEVEGLKIPEVQHSFNEENADWVFLVYLVALSALDLEQKEDYLVLPEGSLGKIYEWLESHIFPYISDKERDEIVFGIGSYATQEGIIDYSPSDIFNEEYEKTIFSEIDK